MGKSKRKGKPRPNPRQMPESALANDLHLERSNMESISGGSEIKKSTKTPVQSENTKGKAFDVSPWVQLFYGRKKQAKTEELLSALKKIEQCRSVLKSLSVEEKEGLFRMSVRNLRERVSQMKDCSAKDIFLASLHYFEEHKSWDCWFCCHCEVRFADKELLVHHLAKKHGWNFLLKFDEIEPKGVDDDITDMIVNGTWKPVDTPRAMLKIQEKATDVNEDFIEGCVDLHEHCRCPDKQIWPLSNNPERAEVLEQIHCLFKSVLCRNGLARTLIDSFINFTMEQVSDFISEAEFHTHGLDKTPLCICFLTGSTLSKVAKMLQTLHDNLGLQMNTDAPVSLLNHRILITDDSLHLHLDKELLGTLGDSGALCTISDDDEIVLGEDKAFLCWLYLGPSIQEHVEAWELLPDTLKQLAKVRFEAVEKELELLQRFQKENSDFQNSIRARESIKRITVEEFEKRKQGAGHAPQSLSSILSTRLEELVMVDVEAICCQCKLEIEAIHDILKVTEEGFNPDNENPFNEDRCIGIAIQMCLYGLSLENVITEAFIVRTVAVLRQTVALYMWASDLDYQIIMVSLLRPFLQEKIEVFFREDAEKRAEAAAEMFLDELEREIQQNITTQGKHINLPAGKPKTKQKNKDHKKSSKGSKRDKLYKLEEKEKDAAHLFVGDELNKVEEENAKLGFFPLGDNLNSGTCAAAARAELIEDERKLEQMLKRQRQIENGAKQKQQADHERKIMVGSKLVSVFGDYRKYLEADELELQQEDKTKSKTEFVVEENKKAATSKLFLPVGEFSEVDDHETSSTAVASKHVGGLNALVAAGLKNDVGDFNCFLNVIVQSLWHLRRFRDMFLTISESLHLHIRDACIVCALHDIFRALSAANADARRESVSPMSLRVALNKLKKDGNSFQEQQMNDSSEVLEIILECIHRIFFWKCVHGVCITHKFFGMKIREEVRCVSCATKSRNLEYISFALLVNAWKLRYLKSYFMIRTSLLEEREKRFDEILMLIQATDKITTCDPDERGCGELNIHHYILSTPPPVFIAVLVWQSGHESLYSISATLEALDTEIDLAVIYEGFDAGQTRHLVSIVCYYGQHYICFARRPEIGGWTLYDDEHVQDVGSWEKVILMCEIRRLQPLILFFEAQ